jgi:glycosyltransferase involved in cell wall biosynthesis
MKIVNLSYSDKFGGAARSAYNIHKSLLSVNIDSKMVVLKKISKDNTVINHTDFFSPFVEKFKNYTSILISKFFFNGNGSFNFFSNPMLVKKINSLKPNFVLIHWIHAEMMSIEDLNKINSIKVFILHDMWWINGCEHYFEESLAKNSHIRNRSIITRLILKRKKKLKIKNIVAPSKWLINCTKMITHSKILNTETINYPLNLKIFKPLKLIKKDNIIRLLFIGFGKFDERRKGLDLLVNILKKVKSKNIELTVIGDVNKDLFKIFQFKVTFINRVNSDKKLNKIYNTSDILLFTSRQDNFPNVVIEAQSSGLPVVAFNAGGLKDIINNNNNGFLCNHFNTVLFSKNIDKLIKNKDLRKKFSNNSRIYALQNLQYKTIGKKYLSYLKKVSN